MSTSGINNQNGKPSGKGTTSTMPYTICGDSQTYPWKVNFGPKFHKKPMRRNKLYAQHKHVSETGAAGES
jgi:hypothetical protein